MFDFPLRLKNLNDIPENYQNLYEQSEDGCVLIEGLAAKFTADTDGQIIETLKVENGTLQQTLSGFREQAETPQALNQKFKDVNLQLENLGGQLETRDHEVSELYRVNGDFMMKEKAASAIKKANGNVALLMPHIWNSLEVSDIDGRRQVQVKEVDGQSHSDQGSPQISVEDLVLKLKDDPAFNNAFDGNTITGGGMSPVQSGRNSRHLNPTDQKSINSKIEEIAAGKVTISL